MNAKPKGPTARARAAKARKRAKEMHLAYAAVDQRDGLICRCCGMGMLIEHHHLRKRSTYPELRTAVSNIILLCAWCHNRVTDGRMRILGTDANQALRFERVA